ncbi:MAG: 3-hydroxy-3-methylglutaryl-CoA reductase [Pseudomonadota bacterium]
MIPAHVLTTLKRLRARFKPGDLADRMRGTTDTVPGIRTIREPTAETIDGLWRRIGESAADALESRAQIADQTSVEEATAYAGNIENLIGTVKVPVGVIGPMRINGLNASGDVLVPLATTEAALVASYARGATAATRAGGITTALLSEEMMRAPAFVFDDVLNAGLFIDWLVDHAEALKAAAEATTRFGKLISVEPVMDNEVVFLVCRFTTGDASGQNMVTLAADAMGDFIAQNCPVPICRRYVEGNFSGDKKGSYFGILRGRGRKVSASVTLPEDIVRRYLRTTVEDMLAYGRVANLGALLSGQIGAQAHFANGLAALYIATGQDAACVAESAVGFTRMEARDGGLYCSVTLPNILVGAVGGGTSLPSQAAALKIMNLPGEQPGAALAEIAAALCLCGEISIVAAMAAGHFAAAHRKLARDR